MIHHWTDDIADVLAGRKRWTVITADCLAVLPTIPAGSVDAVVTDPPYPDQHIERYHYANGVVDVLGTLPCRQFVFWSARADFPLDWTAVHIWDKVVGCASTYERIFERNGQRNYTIIRALFISNKIQAQIMGDTFTGHPSQKPTQLIQKLIARLDANTILDPFTGSGSTGVAAMKMGRRFIGIEIDPTYADIARRRIAEASNHLFAEPTP